MYVNVFAFKHIFIKLMLFMYSRKSLDFKHYLRLQEMRKTTNKIVKYGVWHR